MSKVLDKINDMLVQKFPDAVSVDIYKNEGGMSTTVRYSTGAKAHSVLTLNGTETAVNIIKEEE